MVKIYYNNINIKEEYVDVSILSLIKANLLSTLYLSIITIGIITILSMIFSLIGLQ